LEAARQWYGTTTTATIVKNRSRTVLPPEAGEY
jgi:hypothetical protein